MLAFSKRPPLLERVNRGVAVAAATFAILFIIATTWRLNESWSYSQKIEIPETPSVNDTALSVSSLRIMPMGASTIFGEKNNGDTGWRRDFRDQVVAVGPKVNMVGSARMGDMLDNDCEGHMGNTIESIHEWARAIVPPTQPNLVVLLAGANNIYQLADVDHAHEHLENLIRWILEVSPRATVIMSTLLLSGLPDCVPYYKTVNQRYRELYRRLEEERVPVVLAEVHPESGLPGRPEARDIGPDGAHPTDEGYAKMAKIYSAAVVEADRRGFLQEPVDNGIPADGDLEGEPRIGVPKQERRDLELEARTYSMIQKRGWCGKVDEPVDKPAHEPADDAAADDTADDAVDNPDR